MHLIIKTPPLNQFSYGSFDGFVYHQEWNELRQDKYYEVNLQNLLSQRSWSFFLVYSHDESCWNLLPANKLTIANLGQQPPQLKFTYC